MTSSHFFQSKLLHLKCLWWGMLTVKPSDYVAKVFLCFYGVTSKRSTGRFASEGIPNLNLNKALLYSEERFHWPLKDILENRNDFHILQEG